MTKKNRWNSQRFIERVPEAELESKMAVYRKDFNRFERDHRMEMAQLWHVLFHNDCELKNSIAARYSLDDVVKGETPLIVLKKTEKTLQTNASLESDRRFEAFKAHTAAQLRISVNGRAWHQPERPNYDDLKRIDNRPSANTVNEFNVSRLFDGTYFDYLNGLSAEHGQTDDGNKWRLVRDSSVHSSPIGRIVSSTGSASVDARRTSGTVTYGEKCDRRQEPSKTTTPVNAEARDARRIAVPRGVTSAAELGENRYVAAAAAGGGSRQQISGRFIDNVGVGIGSRLILKRRPTSIDVDNNLPSIVEAAIDGTSGRNVTAISRADSVNERRPASDMEIRLPQISQQA